jgi:hypothetical protein
VTAIRTNLRESDSELKNSRTSIAIQADDNKSLRGRRTMFRGQLFKELRRFGLDSILGDLI